MAINIPTRKEGTLDKISKLLGVANQGVGIVSGVQSIRRTGQEMDANEAMQRRIREGQMTPDEQLKYSKDYNVSPVETPGSIALKTPKGEMAYYSPKAKEDTKSAMGAEAVASNLSKGAKFVPAGTKGATDIIAEIGGKKQLVGFLPPPDQAKEAKLIPANTVVDVNTGNTALKMLDDVGATIGENKDRFGPVAGRLGSWNPYNKDAQVISAQLKTAAQKIGTYLEGGKLTDKDVPKYEAMLPALGDTPEVAADKLELVKRMIATKQKGDEKALADSGYNTGGFKAARGLSIPSVPKREKSGPSELFESAKAAGQKAPKGQIKISNGKETLFIPAGRFPEAAKDGFKVVE